MNIFYALYEKIFLYFNQENYINVNVHVHYIQNVQ